MFDMVHPQICKPIFDYYFVTWNCVDADEPCLLGLSFQLAGKLHFNKMHEGSRFGYLLEYKHHNYDVPWYLSVSLKAMLPGWGENNFIIFSHNSNIISSILSGMVNIFFLFFFHYRMLQPLQSLQPYQQSSYFAYNLIYLWGPYQTHSSAFYNHGIQLKFIVCYS